MNVRCPQCQAMFRVDPERVPPGGIKARCARCSNVFELTREGVPAPAPARSGPRLVESKPLERAAEERPAPRPIPTGPPPIQPRAAAGAVASVTSAPAAATSTLPQAGAPTKRPSFRNQDPTARAQRLARALVSDIVAYNKDKLQRTSGAAALRAEFRDEIRKSWEEYVEQVGLETARDTPYFRDALNEILAKGAKIF